jgi:hypothetical protein
MRVLHTPQKSDFNSSLCSNETSGTQSNSPQNTSDQSVFFEIILSDDSEPGRKTLSRVSESELFFGRARYYYEKKQTRGESSDNRVCEDWTCILS